MWPWLTQGQASVTERTSSDIAPLQSWSCESFSGERVSLVDMQPAPEITGKGLFYYELVKMFLARPQASSSYMAHSLQLLSRTALWDRESGERETHSRSSQERSRSSSSKQTLDTTGYNDLSCHSLVLLKDKRHRAITHVALCDTLKHCLRYH